MKQLPALILLSWFVFSQLYAQTPVLVKDINPGPIPSVLATYTDELHININGILYFTASEKATGVELWRSDGTVAGTYLVKDICPGKRGSFPTNLVNVNGILYFGAEDELHGYELWRSDGTENGTYIVIDLYPGLVSGIGPSYFFLTNVNGTLYFFGFTPEENAGYGIFRTDGTAAGTKPLNPDLPGGRRSAAIHDMITVNGIFYFVAYDITQRITGSELWRIDGPTGDPYLVKDIFPGSRSANPTNLTKVGGVLFFMANNDTSGTELWRSDGTTEGTYLVYEFIPGIAGIDPSRITKMMDVNGILYFVYDQDITGKELWRSDGTSAGTYLVKDIYPGSTASDPQNLTNRNGELIFSANDGQNGTELWRSDGTANGTYLLKDIYGGTIGSDPSNFKVSGGILYFSATNATAGTEL